MSDSRPNGSGQLVDWDLAVSTGTRLARPGPAVTLAEARAAVRDLRRHALAAQEHVRAHTGLVAADAGPGSVAVIDRPGWIQANADGFRAILEPLVDKLEQRRRQSPAGGVTHAVGARVTGVETGAVLAFLSGKVLGQYELFPPYAGTAAAPDDRPGRLLLVAPNIVAAEREMGVDPRDFRLWVCLHEETHRVQFGAAPWLREHLLAQLRVFLDEADVDAAAMLRRVRAAASAISDAVRPDARDGETSLVEAIGTPAQREVLDRITAVMSLLEGHADFVMDGVGPSVVPSVATIRRTFQERRRSSGRLEQVVRRLLGLDAKLRQYRDGEAFVRGVVQRVGMDGFNAVWSSPDNLPTRPELSQPQAWVDRVHGGSGSAPAAELPA
jgi:coenzyme F420 biosynthesis associated uncharacterized protein